VTVVKIETPHELFDHVVTLDVNELLAAPTDIRRAYHACISLLSLRDWIFQKYANQPWSWQNKSQGQMKSKTQFQTALNTIEKSYEIVTDIANASKHMVLETNRSQTNLYGSENVEIVAVKTATGGAIIGGFMLNTVMFNQPPTISTSYRIQVKIDATYFDVLTCVVKANALWVSLLQENSW